jgi:P-type Cu+ transporter
LGQPDVEERMSTGTEIDPVCGMQVDPQTAAASWEYQGVTYYFCARGCLEDFQEDPDAYLP